LDDSSYDFNYGLVTFIVDTVSWDGTNTIITFTDPSVTTSTAIIGNITYNVSSWSGGYPIGGTYSHAEGASTTAIGTYSHAEGQGTTATGAGSHAEGASTTSTGDFSHAEGESTTSTGYFSHAEGDSTTSTGDYSHAEGSGTISSGSHSHAEGSSTTATGDYSHAEGAGSISLGQFSHAEGYQTTALGQGSHAEGWGTIASGSYQHVIGTFNTQGDDNSRFIVGNGSGNSTRLDAFKISSNNSIVIPQTQSAAPFWTGTDGEMVPATVGGQYFLYMWMNGAWRSGSFA
jgi:hypothetical protein